MVRCSVASLSREPVGTSCGSRNQAVQLRVRAVSDGDLQSPWLQMVCAEQKSLQNLRGS